MSVGTMTLQRFNGEEAYAVESATIEHYKDEEDGVYAVTFRAETGGAPIRTLPDTESLHAHPSAEVTLHLRKLPALALKPGQAFTLPKGYDDGEYQTNFYYSEHEPMDNNEVTILQRDGLRVRARLTGTTTDVNFYDGSKPDTKVVVEADFTLQL
jgi:hypothetical protein